MNFKNVLRCIALVSSAMLVACGGGGGGGSSSPTATLQSITITPANPSMVAGTTQQFTATGTYSDASKAQITPTWTSGTPSTAIIGTAGLASGLSAGTTTITASLNGVTASTTLTVINATVTGLTLSNSSSTTADMPVPTASTMTAVASLSNGSTLLLGNANASWASSNPSVATVNSNGVVTAVATGSSTITATYGGKSGTYNFVVNNATINFLAMVASGYNSAASSSGGILDDSVFPKGGTYPLSVAARFSDNAIYSLPNSSVTWLSGATGVLTIDSAGTLTTVGAGSTSIAVTAGGFTRTYPNITVATPVATPIVLSCNSASPMTVTASVWNAAYATDPYNTTNWLTIDQATCGPYTNGVVMGDVTSNTAIALATFATGKTTFNPVQTASSTTITLSKGNSIRIGRVNSIGTIISSNTLYSIIIQ